MEVSSEGFLKRIFFSEKIPFSEKRDINWAAVKWCALGMVAAFIIGVLLIPSSPESLPEGEATQRLAERPQPFEAPPQLSSSRDLSEYYAKDRQSAPSPSRQASMIVGRGGLDYRTQLPPGSRIPLKLLQSAIVSNDAMPIVAVVISDVEHDSGIAIEKGSKVFGEATFDDSGGVASVTWTSIQMANGRERQVSAIGVSPSGHVGIQGRVHSKRAQNVAGSAISRFIGAYAEGSVSRGVLGFSQGGSENGLKTAVAETAKEQADAYASDLKKERRWIELEAGLDCFAVLKQPFAFRDPGSYGP